MLSIGAYINREKNDDRRSAVVAQTIANIFSPKRRYKIQDFLPSYPSMKPPQTPNDMLRVLQSIATRRNDDK